MPVNNSHREKQYINEKNRVTTSYISQEMDALHKEAETGNILILNEMEDFGIHFRHKTVTV